MRKLDGEKTLNKIIENVNSINNDKVYRVICSNEEEKINQLIDYYHYHQDQFVYPFVDKNKNKKKKIDINILSRPIYGLDKNEVIEEENKICKDFNYFYFQYGNDRIPLKRIKSNFIAKVILAIIFAIGLLMFSLVSFLFVESKFLNLNEIRVSLQQLNVMLVVLFFLIIFFIQYNLFLHLTLNFKFYSLLLSIKQKLTRSFFVSNAYLLFLFYPIISLLFLIKEDTLTLEESYIFSNIISPIVFLFTFVLLGVILYFDLSSMKEFNKIVKYSEKLISSGEYDKKMNDIKKLLFK